METLMTLTEWIEKNTETSLWTGTTIDEATQAEIKEWFQYRQVADNAKFAAFFHRLVIANQWRYNEQLRLESIEWDPMVSDYMERQIKDNTRRAGKSTGKGSTDGTSQSDTTTRQTDTASGTTRGNGSGSRSSTTTGSADSKRTTSSITDAEKNSEAGSQSLAGSTPDSRTYGAGGFPDSLNWTYTSAQNEDKSKGHETDHSETKGEDTGHDEHQDKLTESSSDQRTETRNDQHNSNGSSGTKGTTKTVQSTEATSDETTETDHRERYTGRHESPQDLMQRAREYIKGAAALMWLIDKLDPAFLGVFE